jgi:hypothetical protein
LFTRTGNLVFWRAVNGAAGYYFRACFVSIRY